MHPLASVWLIYVLSIFAAQSYSAISPAMFLVKDGIPEGTIVLGPTPSAPERHAAEELRRYISQISGAEFEIAKVEAGGQSGLILLGTIESNPEIRRLETELPELAGLDKEGFAIKMMNTGLVIAGGGPAGVLYGTYTFLEEHLGCRWYAPGEEGEVIPKQDHIRLGRFENVQQPRLRFRGAGIYDAPGSLRWDDGLQ